MESEIARALHIGRWLRLLLGVCLVVIALPVYLEAGSAYNLSSLGLAAGLLVFYLALHYVISRHFRSINRWVGAVLAVTPVFLVWFFGQGRGPLFGQGEGGTAAITFLAVSFLVDFLHAGAGCEVMALPGLILGDRTHLPCILLSPVDAAEAARAAGSGSTPP